MAGPWEKFAPAQPTQEGPWTKFAAPAAPTAPAQQQGRSGGWMDTIDAGIRGAADMATFGLADEFSAGMGALTGIGGEFGEYDKNLAAQRGLDKYDEQNNGGARLGGQVAGGVAGAMLSPAIAPFKGAGLMPAVGNAMVEGGVGAAGYGFGSGEGGAGNRLENAAYAAPVGMATGGALAPISYGAGKLVNGLANRKAENELIRNAPSLDDLQKGASALYQKADDSGVIYTPEFFNKLKGKVQGDLAEDAFLPENQPKISPVLKALDRMGEGNSTFKGTRQLNKMLNNAYDPANEASNRMARGFRNNIDNAMEDAAGAEVIGGNSAEASAALKQANDMASRGYKSEALNEALWKGDLQASSSGSGGNVNNAVRQKLKSILMNDKANRGFSDAQLAQIEKTVRGTPTQNFARQLGKFSPETGALPSLAAAGAAVTNPAYLIPFVAGAGAKRFADKQTLRNALIADAMVRSGKKLPKGADTKVGEALLGMSRTEGALTGEKYGKSLSPLLGALLGR